MKMKQLVGIGLGVLFLTLGVTTAEAQEGTKPKEAGKAKIEVPETSFDFGYVPQGVKISHVYWIKNVGSDTLFIRDVKPG